MMPKWYAVAKTEYRIYTSSFRKYRKLFPLAMILLVGFGFSKGELRRWQGGVLFAIYVIYLVVLFAVVKPSL